MAARLDRVMKYSAMNNPNSIAVQTSNVLTRGDCRCQIAFISSSTSRGSIARRTRRMLHHHFVPGNPGLNIPIRMNFRKSAHAAERKSVLPTSIALSAPGKRHRKTNIAKTVVFELSHSPIAPKSVSDTKQPAALLILHFRKVHPIIKFSCRLIAVRH
jgi:hypothetical protein